MSAPEPEPTPVLPLARHDRAPPERMAPGILANGPASRIAPALPGVRQGEALPDLLPHARSLFLLRRALCAEHGQWVGSLDINTFVVAFGLSLASIFAPDWPIPITLAVWGAAAIVIPLVTFRFSRGLWTAIVHLSGGVY